MSGMRGAVSCAFGGDTARSSSTSRGASMASGSSLGDLPTPSRSASSSSPSLLLPLFSFSELSTSLANLRAKLVGGLKGV